MIYFRGDIRSSQGPKHSYFPLRGHWWEIQAFSIGQLWDKQGLTGCESGLSTFPSVRVRFATHSSLGSYWGRSRWCLQGHRCSHGRTEIKEQSNTGKEYCWAANVDWMYCKAWRGWQLGNRMLPWFQDWSLGWVASAARGSHLGLFRPDQALRSLETWEPDPFSPIPSQPAYGYLEGPPHTPPCPMPYYAGETSQVWVEFGYASREDSCTYGGGDYGSVVWEGTFSTHLQGQLTDYIQHPCCGTACLAHLQGALELVEEVCLCSSH